MPATPGIRPSPIAGTWYEANPARLRQQTESWLDRADLPALPGQIRALIAPHAGHRYSGRVAAHAFAAVRGLTWPLVIVVSPLHRAYPGAVLSSAHSAYATPLGNIDLDEEALAECEAGLAQAGIRLSRAANDQEHSLEIELPFLQVALAAPFQLLPLMLHTHSDTASRKIGKVLAQLVRSRSALLVASTDLSHFFPLAEAERLDREMLRRFASLDPASIYTADAQGSGYACGMDAVASVLYAALELGANQVKTLAYSTSAEMTGDTSSVVGYGAAVVLEAA